MNTPLIPAPPIVAYDLNNTSYLLAPTQSSSLAAAY